MCFNAFMLKRVSFSFQFLVSHLSSLEILISPGYYGGEARDASWLTRFSRCVSFAENRYSDETTSRLLQRQTKVPSDHIHLRRRFIWVTRQICGNCKRWQFLRGLPYVTIVRHRELQIPRENALSGIDRKCRTKKNIKMTEIQSYQCQYNKEIVKQIYYKRRSIVLYIFEIIKSFSRNVNLFAFNNKLVYIYFIFIN